MVYIIIDYMPPEKDTPNRLDDKEQPKNHNTDVVNKHYEPTNISYIIEIKDDPATSQEVTKFIQNMTNDNRRTGQIRETSDSNLNCLTYDIKFN
jgi:hypothetical protein